MSLSVRVRGWAGRLKTGVQYLAGRDGRTPLAAKLTIALAVGYALSPIDLIPDLIPVLGYLDDLIPLGVALAIRMIPDEVLRDCRRRSEDSTSGDATGAVSGSWS